MRKNPRIRVETATGSFHAKPAQLESAPDYFNVNGRAILIRQVHVRGLSAKVGEYAAGAIRQGEGWAIALLAEIRGQRERAA